MSLDSTISTHTAFVYLMVLVSASDRNMTDSELKSIGGIINSLPLFRNYDADRFITDAETCAEILDADGGLEAVFGLVEEAIPDSLHDTAYAVACEIAVADAELTQEELRVLEMIRHGLNVDRLVAAAIERGIVARNRSYVEE